MKVCILGVKIDKINQAEAAELIEKWIWHPGKHYIVTPNPEMIVAAQKDLEFRRVLNNADLAIPDSSSLGFSYWLLKRNIFLRFLLWPLFFLPVKQLMHFDKVAGTDLMEALCKLAAEKGFTTGFLGGENGVAKKCAECLMEKYPNLKVVFAGSGGEVDNNGQIRGEDLRFTIYDLKKEKNHKSLFVNHKSLPPADLLFVAFGHIKQEKWMVNNLQKTPAHVMMGVGGAFDYLSGNVPRAPKWVQGLGFEWLYRLIVQPWRFKRQLSLVKFVWLILFS